jgi:hypothetical protein
LTTFADDPAALGAILTVWNSTDDYTTRVDTLRTGSGPVLNNLFFHGVKLETNTTVLSDGVRDELAGNGGRDWFFADLVIDVLEDRGSDEEVDVFEGALGDIDRNGVIDAEDIDLLYDQIPGTGPVDPRFDLVPDGTIDQQDVDWLVHDILGREYGDTNLDGRIDLSDYNMMVGNFDPLGANPDLGWSEGDFDGDGNVDLSDYVTLASNFNPVGYELAGVAGKRASGGQEPESAAEVCGGISGDRQGETAARSKSAAAPLGFSEDEDTVQPQGARAVRRRAAEPEISTLL